VILVRAENWCAIRARKVLQRLMLTCTGKEAFNCFLRLFNNLSNKGNILEIVEEGNYHSFFNTGYYFSWLVFGCLLFLYYGRFYIAKSVNYN